MQRAKSPGLDGQPPELFLELWDIVGPLLLDSFKYALGTGSFHCDQNTSLISVLLNKGKPPLRCRSYRLISLITTELKLFAKVLVRRQEPYVGKLIHHDQTGFLKGKTVSENIRWLFHIIHASESDAYPHKSLLVPLNASAKNFTLPATPHIQWHNSAFTYLGLNITKFSDILHTNYYKLKLEISSDLQRWSDLKMSLQGRISIIRMNVLGPLNFLFSVIPMPPPAKYFDELQSLISKFIWKGKRPHIGSCLQGAFCDCDCLVFYWCNVIYSIQ